MDPFGFGWSLSLPTITRKTDKGLSQYLDGHEQTSDSDIFILSGAEDLVPEFEKNAGGDWIITNGRQVVHDKPHTVDRATYRVRRYRPRIEGLFVRIERWTSRSNPADVFWRSISKDNITTWYGKTPESRIQDPTDPSRIFSGSSARLMMIKAMCSCTDINPRTPQVSISIRLMNEIAWINLALFSVT